MKKHIDASQAYFWTRKWQAGEREASAEIATGQTKRFPSVEALIRDLADPRSTPAEAALA